METMLPEHREQAAPDDQTAQADAAKPNEMEPDREADVGATGDPTDKQAWVTECWNWQKAYSAQPTCCQEFQLYKHSDKLSHTHIND